MKPQKSLPEPSPTTKPQRMTPTMPSAKLVTEVLTPLQTYAMTRLETRLRRPWNTAAKSTPQTPTMVMEYPSTALMTPLMPPPKRMRLKILRRQWPDVPIEFYEFSCQPMPQSIIGCAHLRLITSLRVIPHLWHLCQDVFVRVQPAPTAPIHG